jgi:hypothetical protein
MDTSSFADLKTDLEDACAFLRSFTLARPGYTRQDALAGIGRVKARCDRLKKLFASGPNAEEAAAVAALARAGVAAAETRLALLGQQGG